MHILSGLPPPSTLPFDLVRHSLLLYTCLIEDPRTSNFHPSGLCIPYYLDLFSFPPFNVGFVTPSSSDKIPIQDYALPAKTFCITFLHRASAVYRQVVFFISLVGAYNHSCSTIFPCHMAVMTSLRLKIDTSIALVSPPHPADPNSNGHTPNSARYISNRSLRDHSSSPTASALSLVSPADSSANASTSSLLLPQAPSLYSTTTVDTHSDLSPSEQPQPEYVLAMHDYVPEQRNATCLAFLAGQVIRVLNRDPSGWWDGELDGSRGWFPSNYVNGDLALLADDHLPQSISVRPCFLFTLPVSNSRIYISGSEYDTLQTIPPSHLLPLVYFHLGRALSLEMIIALPRWFHCSMLCRCCTTLFGQIE